jgi:2'-5' RNA ligase
MGYGVVRGTAFVVLVPEAEALVAALRARFDPSSALGVPAHITVLHPFMAPTQVTPEVLTRAVAALDDSPVFGFTLERVARFPGVVYLAPQPAALFIALTEALVRAFPAFPPFGGAHDGIVPHLTVAQGDDDTMRQADAGLRAALRENGPVAAQCRSLCLLENAGGRWREMQRLALPAQGTPAQ